MTEPVAGDSPGTEALRERIAAALLAARDRTRGLTDCVDDTDLVRQHSRLMSPLVWDLAHVGNQEELWLLRAVGRREPMHPEIDPLYDAFEHPRTERPSLPLLAPREARSYVGDVRGRVLGLLEHTPLEGAPPGGALPAEVFVPSGPFTMGTSAEPWALDNERPAHTVDVGSFFIDTTPVTNAEYIGFIDDGGYDEPRWWSTQGWDHRRRAALTAPLFWHREGGQWLRRRFGVIEPVVPAAPVVH